jgi:hypothetical protein
MPMAKHYATPAEFLANHPDLARAMTRPLPFELFAARHPYRIDIRDGHHVRFTSIGCAANSALYHNAPVWDEARGMQFTLSDCHSITNPR